MYISGDLVHPDQKFAFSSIGMTVFNDTGKNFLHQVFTGLAVSGQPIQVIEKFYMVSFKEDGQHFHSVILYHYHDFFIR
jgi:hypothetical protein